MPSLVILLPFCRRHPILRRLGCLFRAPFYTQQNFLFMFFINNFLLDSNKAIVHVGDRYSELNMKQLIAIGKANEATSDGYFFLVL